MAKVLPSLLVVGVLSAASTFAEIETQLFLDAGGGVKATVNVSTGNVVTCTGSCSNLTFSSTGDHGQLTVQNKVGKLFGNFSVGYTGNGSAVAVRPDLQDFNQVDVENKGTSGSLHATFTETDYTEFARRFQIGVSLVALTKAASVTFTGFASNSLPGDVDILPAKTAIGVFSNQTGPSSANSDTLANPISPNGPYSLSADTVINFTKRGSVQANYSIAAIPEPAVMSFIGGFVLFAAAGLRRRFALTA